LKPETKKKLDELKAKKLAAEQRLADAEKAQRAQGATEDTGTTGSPQVDLSRRIEVLERTVRDYESQGRSRAVTGTAKAFTAKNSPEESQCGASLGIDGNKFSIVKSLLARNEFEKHGDAKKAFAGAEYEREALEAYYAAKSVGSMQKTMTFGDESSGGFLVPPEVRATIDPLRSSTWVDQIGVQKLSGLTYAPVIFPRVTADNTSYWVGEGTTTTTSDPAFDEIRLNPKILVNGTKLSLTLMKHAPAVAENLARQSIAASMQRKFELGLIEGGTGAPVGLKDISGIGSVAFTSKNGNEKQYLINQMVLELTQDNVPTAGAQFLTSEKVWANLYNLFYVGAGTVGTNLASAAKLGNFAWVDPSGQKWLAGYKLFTTNNLTVSTTGELYFGQWNQFMVADWGAAEMKMTTEGSTLTLARQALIATFPEVDSALMHPEAICKGTAYTVALSAA